MMKIALLVAALTGFMVGCAGPAGDREVLTITLKGGQQNPSAIGQASLVGQGDVTGVTFLIGGMPPGLSRPLQLLTFIYSGTCAQLSAEPVYSMNTATETTATETGWRLSRQVPAALDDLLLAPHALLVRTSAVDRNLDVYCGDIPRQ